MKKNISLVVILLSILVLGSVVSNEVLGDDTAGNELLCNLDEYRIASASDIMMIDLSNQDCEVVGNDIMEFSELLVLDISNKKLEDQSILSAFPNLLALNAEHSNLNTLEYISTTVEDLYVAYSDISGLDTLSNYTNLLNYSLDYLPLDNVSRDILRSYDTNSKLIPMITKLEVNGKVLNNSHGNVVTTRLVNELVVDYDGNDTYELHVVNDTTNEEVLLDNGVFKLNTKEVYRVTYGNDEYQDSRVITFTYMEYNAPIITKVTTISSYTPSCSIPEEIIQEDSGDSSEEDNNVVSENIEATEDDVKMPVCGAK